VESLALAGRGEGPRRGAGQAAAPHRRPADDGSIQTLRLQGALSDALSWFGLSDAADAMHNYELGRGPWYDVLLAPPKATINKLGTALSPLFTLPFETISGKKLFPDLFATRFIRDKWRNAFQTFSLENEYDWLMGKPSRGYAQVVGRGVVYSRDPGEIAYNEARGITYDWLKRVKGQVDPGGYQSTARRALRLAGGAQVRRQAEAEERALERLQKLGVTGRPQALDQGGGPARPDCEEGPQGLPRLS
jgi:hypothetical protein